MGPEEDLRALVDHAKAALEFRIGLSLVELFTDEQVNEFDAISEGNDAETERLKYLSTIVPDYDTFVDTEVERLKHNITADPNPAAYIRNLDT